MCVVTACFSDNRWPSGARHEVETPVNEWTAPLMWLHARPVPGFICKKGGRVSRSAIVFVGAGDG